MIYFSAVGQNQNTNLKKADSLFAAGRYGESLALYENLLIKNDVFTPQMLLKMAFTEEKEGDYAKALYYLNFYYRTKPDKQILKKLEELANEHQLEGYKYTDKTYFIALYQNYKWYVTGFLIIIVLLMGWWLISRKRQGRIITPPMVGGLIAIGVLLLLHNFATQKTTAIIKNDYTTLSASPSAAGKVLAVLSKGNRYEIIEKTDIWYKIQLPNDKEGFIRLHNTLIVQ